MTTRADEERAACRYCGATGWHKMSCSAGDSRNAAWLPSADSGAPESAQDQDEE